MGGDSLELSLKLILSGILVINIIPLGVKNSMLIEEEYQESIIDDANNHKEYKPNSGNLLDNMQGGAMEYIATEFLDLVNSVNSTIYSASDYIKSIPERLKNALNNVLEATAVLLVTTCVFLLV